MSSCSSSRRVSTAAVLTDNDQLVLVKRAPGGDLGGLWELPGGKVDPGETAEEALARELGEELGVVATVGPCLATIDFEHDGVGFTLQAHRVQADLSGIKLNEHTAIARVAVADALDLDLAPSDRSLLEKYGNQLIRD